MARLVQSLGAILVLGSILVLVQADREQAEHEHKHVETTERKGPLGLMGSEKKKTETHVEHGEEQRHGHRLRRERKGKLVELNDIERDRLLKFKDEQLLFQKVIESYENCPITQKDRKCFSKLKSGQSIDIVIDVAPSPTQDKLDKLSSDSPIGLFWERVYRKPSRAYFNAIQMFIDIVTLEVKPEFCHSVIYDVNEKQKLYLRGRSCEDVEGVKKVESAEFEDKSRYLRTLWPHCSKQVYSDLYPIVKNNLGRMTKLALWNRDNGLPTVFLSSRPSKPLYTIVITDGWSGASINDLTDDLSRTTVIDIGNRRFVDKLDWNHFRNLAGTFVLTAPQQLSLMTDTVRNMACRFLENEVVEQ
jgi:hypothetical protein